MELLRKDYFYTYKKEIHKKEKEKEIPENLWTSTTEKLPDEIYVDGDSLIFHVVRNYVSDLKGETLENFKKACQEDFHLTIEKSCNVISKEVQERLNLLKGATLVFNNGEIHPLKERRVKLREERKQKALEKKQGTTYLIHSCEEIQKKFTAKILVQEPDKFCGSKGVCYSYDMDVFLFGADKVYKHVDGTLMVLTFDDLYSALKLEEGSKEKRKKYIEWCVKRGTEYNLGYLGKCLKKFVDEKLTKEMEQVIAYILEPISEP